MAAGGGRYYLELACEDYYLKGGEPPGYWLGEGARSLGLEGEACRDDLHKLLQGFGPDGEKLVRNAGEKGRQVGWDLTFSAPKSVSVLFSQLDRASRDEIRAAQAAAVEGAMGYLENEACWTRRGKGGFIREKAALVAAAFEHGTSRSLDPQLHTHVLALNVCRRSDGTTGTLASPEFYQHRMAAGALYRVELARQLERRLGVAIQRDGIFFKVAGVPDSLVEFFSKRRAEIEKYLAESGHSGARASEVAALATRVAKEATSRSVLYEQWKEQGREHGWDPELFAAQTRVANALWRHDAPQLALGEAVSNGLAEVTRENTYFSKPNLVRRAAEQAQGKGVSLDEVVAAVEASMGETICVGPLRGQTQYTTPELLDLEKNFLAAVDRMRAQQCPRQTPVEAVLGALQRSPQLNDQQRELVGQIATGREMLGGFCGMAGTGKTTLLRAAAEALGEAGFDVRGAALAGKAALGLQEGAGIESSTIASLLFRVERSRQSFSVRQAVIDHHKWVWGGIKSGTISPLKPPRFSLLRAMERFEKFRPENPLKDSTVLLVDEAGMVGLRDMDRLVRYCEEAGTRLVLVGDPNQLQPIEAGGAFASVAGRLKFRELNEIIRQEDGWQKESVRDFSLGKSRQALKPYFERGLVTVADDEVVRRRELLADWKRVGMEKPEEHFVLAGTRREVRILNREIQLARKAAGLLGEESLEVGSERLHEGDRVLFTGNAKPRGVANGDQGTVIGLDQGSGTLTVQLDRNQRAVAIPLHDYDHLQLGYAATTHKAQGMTAENVYVSTDTAMQDLHLSYVQASRARKVTRFYTTRDEAGPDLSELAKSMGKNRRKLLASDLMAGDPHPLPEPPRPITLQP
jgi:conjugative relaxase-like TrwC/TraI family protein